MVVLYFLSLLVVIWPEPNCPSPARSCPVTPFQCIPCRALPYFNDALPFTPFQSIPAVSFPTIRMPWFDTPFQSIPYSSLPYLALTASSSWSRQACFPHQWHDIVGFHIMRLSGVNFLHPAVTLSSSPPQADFFLFSNVFPWLYLRQLPRRDADAILFSLLFWRYKNYL